MVIRAAATRAERVPAARMINRPVPTDVYEWLYADSPACIRCKDERKKVAWKLLGLRWTEHEEWTVVEEIEKFVDSAMFFRGNAGDWSIPTYKLSHCWRLFGSRSVYRSSGIAQGIVPGGRSATLGVIQWTSSLTASSLNCTGEIVGGKCPWAWSVADSLRTSIHLIVSHSPLFRLAFARRQLRRYDGARRGGRAGRSPEKRER